MNQLDRIRTEVLVVGSGIAGLSFSLKACRYADVLLVTKKQRLESNTNYAQGGVAAVFAPNDSHGLHVADTLVAGAGLCHQRAVEELAREGPERVKELMDWGVRFSRENGRVSLGREAGHSARRILHAADLTGQEIERALLAAVAAEPKITLLPEEQLVNRFFGLDLENTLQIFTVQAPDNHHQLAEHCSVLILHVEELL